MTKNCDCHNDDIDKKPALDIIQSYKGKDGSLMPILQDVQSIYGYLPETILNTVSKETNTPMSRIYGIATFYSQFRLSPVGKNLIRVCHGTACHVSGAENITLALETELGVNDGGTTEDNQFTLESVACLGCCSLAPVIMVNEETHGSLTPDKSKKITKKYDQKEH